MSVHFQPAQPENLPEFLSMMEDFYALFDYPFNPESATKSYYELLNNPALGRVWVIQSDSQIIGYIALVFGFSFGYGGRDAMLDELYLTADSRGQGIGNQTMGFLEDQVRLMGIEALHLEVESDNLKALDLYKGRGFKGSNRIFLTKKLSE